MHSTVHRCLFPPIDGGALFLPPPTFQDPGGEHAPPFFGTLGGKFFVPPQKYGGGNDSQFPPPLWGGECFPPIVGGKSKTCPPHPNGGEHTQYQHQCLPHLHALPRRPPRLKRFKGEVKTKMARRRLKILAFPSVCVIDFPLEIVFTDFKNLEIPACGALTFWNRSELF